MTFYADLHIHSKYSRATSRDCDLEHLAYWARKKGVAVLGTGDFTHPQWFDEIKEKLVPAEPGLFRLRPDLERQIDDWLDGPGGEPTRFMLEVEVSTIYKKDDRVRKVHHLIYAPDLDKARAFNERLGRIGNIASDGRPILGLDSRHLLEITLESGEGCYLIPAHIWTPWFAVLGSKSGFDTIEHCYGDLAGEIFAVETGLSSDPAMNRRLSMLDRYTLVSNSDAHSPPKIGREACAFDTDMDYFAMRRALETGVGYGGTVEFFPEEGKYHLDGHRKCGVCLNPGESRKHDGLCPVCGKPLTLGVMHRIDELADRDEEQAPTSAADAYRSFVPLDEVLSEIEGVGPKSKAVRHKYEGLVSKLGSELFILEHAPLDEVQRAGSSLVAEAVSRMRDGRVIRQSGYDGEYGVIRLFTEDELRKRSAVGALFDMSPPETSKSLYQNGGAGVLPASDRRPESHLTSRLRLDDRRDACPTGHSDKHAKVITPGTMPSPVPPATVDGKPDDPLDPDQRAAAEAIHGPLLIVAGPGTGKTRTLTHRLAHLIRDHGVPPEQCLAITFTRRAAGEMSERLAKLLPDAADRVPVTTFHALGLTILQEHGPQPLRVATEAERLELLQQTLSLSPKRAARKLSQLSRAKRDGQPSADADAVVYQQAMRDRGLVDFDDLLTMPVQLLDDNPDLIEQYRARYHWVSIDEYQDIDAVQYRLIRLLVPPDGNLCAIGDPDQAIYGFRGADVRYFQQFQEDYPDARTVHLTRNYRSTRTIIDASLQLITPTSLVADRDLRAQIDGLDRVEIHECPTERAEAESVVHRIERMIGGSAFFSLDSGRVETHEGQSRSFSDFAVLYRTDAQADALVEAFDRSGMPFQKRSHAPLAEQPEVEALMQAMDEMEDHAPTECCVADRLDQAAAVVRTEHPRVDAYLPALRTLADRHASDLTASVEKRAATVRERARPTNKTARSLTVAARQSVFQQSLAALRSELALGVDVDLWDERADRVSLLTLHAAKGLEFPVVFIVGCEDGIVPLRWGAAAEDADLAEERRLFFVGMTRAQRRLFLTHARQRPWRGPVRPMTRSPFLDDIEQELLASHIHRPTRGKPGPRHEQMTFFE